MQKHKKIKSTFSDVFELPKDIVLDLPKINVIGNIQLYIENHRGVIQYTDTLVRVGVIGGEVVIKGKKLVIKNISLDEIFIEGEIIGINYGD